MIADGKAIVKTTIAKTTFHYCSNSSALVNDIRENEKICDFIASPPFFNGNLKGNKINVKSTTGYSNTNMNNAQAFTIVVDYTKENIFDFYKDSVIVNVSDKTNSNPHKLNFMYGTTTVVTNNSLGSKLNITNPSLLLTSPTIITGKVKCVNKYCMQHVINKVDGIGVRYCNDLRVKEKIFNYYKDKKSVTLRSQSTPITYYNEATVVVSNNIPLEGFGTINVTPVSINVENYRPPIFSNTGSNSGMKNIRIVVQKGSFVEINIDFENAIVKEIQGLPKGLIFEKKYLKGSPILSGKYPITLALDNGFNLEGLIVVPELPRRL